MADLDEFLKPRVETDVEDGPEGPETVWKVPFTQFLRPDGRRRPVNWITPEKAIADKAQAILDAGFHFTCEELLTGDAVFYITGRMQHSPEEAPEEDDVAIAICRNGPAVPQKVSVMIRDFQIPEDGIVRKWRQP